MQSPNAVLYCTLAVTGNPALRTLLYGADQNGKPARKTAAAPTSRVSSDSNAESTQSQASARDRGQQQGGRGQPMAKTSAATRPTSASKQTNPTAILQPPSRQLSSSPVPRYHIASPNQSSQQPLHPSPGNVNAQSSGATSSGSPNGGMQSRRAQGEAASQGRRQRQQRASPSPGHNLHRQAVHARAEQAMMQEPGQAHGSELNSQPADASVLRVQQSNVMPNSAAGSAVPGVANGSPQVAQKASVGSADMQRTASGKLRATAAPFVPRSASGSPLSTSST